MTDRIHEFDNGIRIYDAHLARHQRERYREQNVHEAVEEELFVQILKSIPSDGLFVNIGSAVGYYPLRAKIVSPNLTIHAVEPLERHRQFFLDNIRLNGFDPSDFVIHTEGIAQEKGVAKFLDRNYGSAIIENEPGPEAIEYSLKGFVKAILYRLELKKRRPNIVTTIETISLDTLLDGIHGTVDLVQMDVQGEEVNVLRGGVESMRMGKVKTFLIGTHSRELHQYCIQMLSDHGYRIEFEEAEPDGQPDGILIASRGRQAQAA